MPTPGLNQPTNNPRNNYHPQNYIPPEILDSTELQKTSLLWS